MLDLTTISDDDFLFHLYGSFQESWTGNATIESRVDCGSHCEEYGVPPGEMPSETWTPQFCDMTEIEQPTGGKKNVTCPPVPGYALLTSPGYVWPLMFHNSVRCSQTCLFVSVYQHIY
jgi:hypothetical protein